MTTFWKLAGLATVVCLATSAPLAKQRPNPRAALTLPAAGTFDAGGEFRGTISINRFERRGSGIIAIGFVSGVLSRGGQPLGTAVAGEVSWPVVVRSGGVSIASYREPGAARPSKVPATPRVRPASSFVLAQESCPVLNIALGPDTVNLLGFDVAFSGFTLDITGITGTPLGDLVCSVSDLLGNVAGLVDLLNGILGLLTGLLGGLTGGLGLGTLPAAVVAGIG